MIHYKWHLTKTSGKKTTRRNDYDIALVRLDYPAIDELSGKSTFTSLLCHIAVSPLTQSAGARQKVHLDMWRTVSFPI